MICKKCGYDYPAKELKCPYCGEVNPLGEKWENEENLARKETLLTKARVIHSMPLYVADKVMNVILLVITAVTALTFLVLAIVFGLEGIHITRQHNQASVQEAEELFTEHPDIDTLICATDTMAVGAVNWLKKSGYHIPDQVQVAGMGDSYLGKIIEPKLTTVHFFYKTSGMESAKMLVDLMESENISIHKEIKMGCKVVMRESHRNI